LGESAAASGIISVPYVVAKTVEVIQERSKSEGVHGHGEWTSLGRAFLRQKFKTAFIIEHKNASGYTVSVYEHKLHCWASVLNIPEGYSAIYTVKGIVRVN